MHEDFIKKAVKLKFDLAEKLLGHLPDEASKKIRDYGNLIYKSVGENLGREIKKTEGPSKKINNVVIE